MKNAIVFALFAAIIAIICILAYAVYVQLSSGDLGDDAGKVLCLAAILIPAFFAFELLFKRYHYVRKEPEPEDEDSS